MSNSSDADSSEPRAFKGRLDRAAIFSPEWVLLHTASQDIKRVASGDKGAPPDSPYIIAEVLVHGLYASGLLAASDPMQVISAVYPTFVALMHLAQQKGEIEFLDEPVRFTEPEPGERVIVN